MISVLGHESVGVVASDERARSAPDCAHDQPPGGLRPSAQGLAVPRMPSIR